MSQVSLPEAVQAVVDAINNGDTEAFVMAFRSDGSVDDWGRILRGSAGIRSWAGSDAIGQNAQMTVIEASTDGDVTHIVFDWESKRFNGRSEAFVTVSQGLVSEFRIPSH